MATKHGHEGAGRPAGRTGGTLYSFDPGARKYAWARFVDGALRGAGETDADEWNDLILPHSWATDGTRAVIELPRIYPVRRWKGDANDLIRVAVTAGAIAGALGAPVQFVEPRAWKGSRPKDVDNRYTLGLLSEAERATMDATSHDVVDAVGLGLWALGRR